MAFPRLTTAILGALLLAGSSQAIAAPAQAHDYLVSSTPPAGETLAELPAEFSITVNDVVPDLGQASGGFALQVTDGAGLYYGDGCLTLDGATVSTAAAIGAPGEYTMRWSVISADSHPVTDEFSFTWAPSGAVTESPGSATAPVCGVPSAEPDGTAPETDATDGANDGATDEKTDDTTSDTTTETDASTAASESDTNLGIVLWIGGALAVLAVAVGVTLVVLRRRSNPAR